MATSSYANGVQTFTQSSGSSSRSVSWTKNATGDITTYTDATGKKTTFGYTSGDLTEDEFGGRRWAGPRQREEIGPAPERGA